MCTQRGHANVVSLLLRGGANVEATTLKLGTARDIAVSSNNTEVLQVIDVHLCHQLRLQLVDLCVALRPLCLPVLVLLECFAWTASTSYAAQHVTIPLELQWRIAKGWHDQPDF